MGKHIQRCISKTQKSKDKGQYKKITNFFKYSLEIAKFPMTVLNTT